MKKLLVAVMTLASVTAFANHNHLVTFDGDMLKHYANFVTGSIDGTNGGADTDYDGLSLEVNYAWKVHSNIFVGGILGFGQSERETGAAKTETDYLTYGVRAIYDFSTDHANSMYATFSYVIETEEAKNAAGTTTTDDEDTHITLEFGKRFGNFTNLAGVNVTYAPSIAYRMTDYDDKLPGATSTDGTEIRLNLVKFDVLF